MTRLPILSEYLDLADALKMSEDTRARYYKGRGFALLHDNAVGAVDGLILVNTDREYPLVEHFSYTGADTNAYTEMLSTLCNLVQNRGYAKFYIAVPPKGYGIVPTLLEHKFFFKRKRGVSILMGRKVGNSGY